MPNNNNKKKTKNGVDVKVSILSAGGVIGEEVFFNQNYSYTCTVLSPVSTILVGDVKSIKVKFPNSVKSKFKEMFEKKEVVR